mmetsp:Transcript_2824/g.17566  ORF Transcript_2824/g.17566 Transcript_2824/m.17566 type:complete len:337 (+) Transcript_2824:1579-2589(+)
MGKLKLSIVWLLKFDGCSCICIHNFDRFYRNWRYLAVGSREPLCAMFSARLDIGSALRIRGAYKRILLHILVAWLPSIPRSFSFSSFHFRGGNASSPMSMDEKVESGSQESQYLRCRNTFFDLGANSGDTLKRLFSKKADRSRKYRSIGAVLRKTNLTVGSMCVLSFEGNPRFSRQLQLFQRRHAHDCLLLEVFSETAVYFRNENVTFYLDSLNSRTQPGSSLVSEKVTSTQKNAVRIQGIDFGELLEKISIITHEYWNGVVIVKMDLEGFEYSLLRNLIARGLLCKNVDYLLVEFHDIATKFRDDVGVPSQVDKLLKWLANENQCKTEVIDLEGT